jgi:hypothetical protein
MCAKVTDLRDCLGEIISNTRTSARLCLYRKLQPTTRHLNYHLRGWKGASACSRQSEKMLVRGVEGEEEVNNHIASCYACLSFPPISVMIPDIHKCM